MKNKIAYFKGMARILQFTTVNVDSYHDQSRSIIKPLCDQERLIFLWTQEAAAICSSPAPRITKNTILLEAWQKNP